MKNILRTLLFVCFYAFAGAQSHELVIVHTNDTHSQIEPFTDKTDTNVGGFLRRDALIREVRAQHSNVLLVDAGDYSQGTPYFNFFKGYTEIALMNAMGYDVAGLGNHEFDNGSAALAKRIHKAHFPVVCANYEFHNKALAKAVKSYAILEKNGLKIGVFGLLVDIRALVAPAIADEVAYLDPIESARRAVEELQKQNCDMIVCLSHLGFGNDVLVNDEQVAEAVPGIDIIIGGHTHTELKEPVQVGNTMIYQLAAKGKCAGVITINY